MPDAPVYRCFDDRCRVRTTCRWWHRRNERHGQVAMTWRVGWECLDELCHQATKAMDKFKSEAR